MSNHVHLVVVPKTPEALPAALKITHGNYASYWNAAHRSSGHVWQGRFYSCPLDDYHVWVALRYTERNPVRAGLVADPAQWPWSSAGAHCGGGEADGWLDMEAWRKRWSKESWRGFLAMGETESEVSAIRRCTHTGRPLGNREFVDGLEQATQRRLTARKGGRPAQPPDQRPQTMLPFEGAQ